jgi:hypothetical protein
VRVVQHGLEIHVHADVKCPTPASHSTELSHVMSKVVTTITLEYEIPYLAGFMFFQQNFIQLSTRNDPLQETLTQARVWTLGAAAPTQGQVSTRTGGRGCVCVCVCDTVHRSKGC